MDEEMWTMGLYIKSAIASTLSDKNKYPDEPFSYKSSSVDNSERELSHEEIVRQTEALFGQLNIMAINYNLEHKNKASTAFIM